MQRHTLKLISLFFGVGLATVALAGCGAADQAPDDFSGADVESLSETDVQTEELPAKPAGAADQATLSYGDTTYTAELAFCAMQNGEESLFHGVASDDSGDVVGYLSGDFGTLSDYPYGEVRIDFGATEQFQSSDEFVAMGDVAGPIVVTAFDGSSLIIMGGAWDQEGDQLGTATLRVEC